MLLREREKAAVRAWVLSDQPLNAVSLSSPRHRSYPYQRPRFGRSISSRFSEIQFTLVGKCKPEEKLVPRVLQPAYDGVVTAKENPALSMTMNNQARMSVRDELIGARIKLRA